MSRGLQMLVEEGERSSCAHAVRSVGSRNRPRFHQKTAKTANSVDGIIKKRKKLRFGAPRRTENSENCISQPWESQKHPKATPTKEDPHLAQA